MESKVRRLIGAVLVEQHDEWQVCRRYLAPVHAQACLDIIYEEASLPVGTA
jgi:hypothetical protein